MLSASVDSLDFEKYGGTMPTKEQVEKQTVNPLSSDDKNESFCFAVPDRIQLKRNMRIQEIGDNFSERLLPIQKSLAFSMYTSSIIASTHSNDGEELDLKFNKEEVEKIRQKKKRMKLNLSFENELDNENDDSEENDPEYVDMGIKIEPFNMKKELEEGSFDEYGHYIFRRKNRHIRNFYIESKKRKSNKMENDDNDFGDDNDNDNDNEEDTIDNWLSSVDQGDANASFKSEEERLRIISKKVIEEQNIEVNIQETLKKLVSYLAENETPADALKRIRKLSLVGIDSQNIRKIKSDISDNCCKTADSNNLLDLTNAVDLNKNNNKKKNKNLKNQITPEGKQKIDEITGLCDALMAEGKSVYFKTTEELHAMIESMEGENENDIPNKMNELEKPFWEFRWTNAEDGKIYGFFSSLQMISWIQQGYISATNPIEARMSKDDMIDATQNCSWMSFVEFYNYLVGLSNQNFVLKN